jgi:hypothetical protein
MKQNVTENDIFINVSENTSVYLQPLLKPLTGASNKNFQTLI